MPDYHGEGGATANTERYRELVALRKRDEEMDRHLRVIHSPVPEPEPEPEPKPEPKGETQGAPRTQSKPTPEPVSPGIKLFDSKGNELTEILDRTSDKGRRTVDSDANVVRPRADYARRSRLRKEIMPGILYRHNALRALVRDAEHRERREQSQTERNALIDDICGPRKRRKR